MHTFKSVVAQLGDAQVVGGAIVVHRDGKHIDVGRVSSETATFILTPAGRALLEAAPVAEKPAKRSSRKVDPAELEL